MITIVSQPSDRTWSNNDIIFKLRATDDEGQIYGEKGVTGQIRFSAGSNPATFIVGNSVIISLDIGANNYTETFMVVAEPTGLNELPAGSSDEAFGIYFKRILSKFQTHPRLSTYFEIKDTMVPGYFNIEFVAKEVSADWALGFAVNSTAAIIPFVQNDVQDNPSPDNYKVKFEVCFQSIYEAGTFESVLQSEAQPDADGMIRLNLQKTIHKECLKSLPNPPVPPFGLTEIIEADNIRKYYIRYAEAEGEIETVGAYIDTSVQEVLLGGIDKETFAYTDYLSQLSENQSFLTWQTPQREVTEGQTDFLNWYNYSDIEKSVVLELRRFSPSGELSKRYLFDAFPHTKVGAKKTAIIPINTEFFAIEDSLAFAVRVVDGTSPYDSGNPTYLSSEVTYTLDFDYHESLRHLVFLNSFFLPETVKLTGVLTKDLEVDRQLSATIVQDGYRATDKDMAQNDFDWENVYIYRSGYISKIEADALQQMLIYNYVYEVGELNYRPLLIEGKKFKITETLKFLHSIEFTAVRALKAENYLNFLLPFVLCTYPNSLEFVNNCIVLFQNAALSFE